MGWGPPPPCNLCRTPSGGGSRLGRTHVTRIFPFPTSFLTAHTLHSAILHKNFPRNFEIVTASMKTMLGELRNLILSEIPSHKRTLSGELRAQIIDDPSPEAERKAARAFLAKVPTIGKVPAQQPYAASRDEDFIKGWYVGATLSKIMKADKPEWCNLEDAREAIYVGQRAGYSDEDIAAYLVRNYDV